MDNRPIGVFDSGLGGLTTVRQLLRQLPEEEIIYFGDTGRVPYGTRSRDTIIKYAKQDMEFLMQFDIKAAIIACNTADAVALPIIGGDYSIPIFGVVKPSANAAVKIAKNNKIGLIGTPATIRSGAYEEIINAAGTRAQVQSVACPLLVPLVENGRFLRGDVVIEKVVAEYLAPLREWGCDTLVLGCTHYPLLWDVIADYMGGGVQLINSGKEAVRAVTDYLGSNDRFTGKRGSGGCSYYVSDSTDNFSQLASILLEQDVSGTVCQIDIEKY